MAELLLHCGDSPLKLLPKYDINFMDMETYRSGRNGADSKSVYQFMLIQGFESLRLRYIGIPLGILFYYIMMIPMPINIHLRTPIKYLY